MDVNRDQTDKDRQERDAFWAAHHDVAGAARAHSSLCTRSARGGASAR